MSLPMTFSISSKSIPSSSCGNTNVELVHRKVQVCLELVEKGHNGLARVPHIVDQQHRRAGLQALPQIRGGVHDDGSLAHLIHSRVARGPNSNVVRVHVMPLEELVDAAPDRRPTAPQSHHELWLEAVLEQLGAQGIRVLPNRVWRNVVLLNRHALKITLPM